MLDSKRKDTTLRTHTETRWLVAALLFVTLMLPAGGALAQEVKVGLNGSKVVSPEGGISQISIADDKIADIKLVSGQVLVMGKALGQTHLTIWSNRGNVTRYSVVVELPVKEIQAKLRSVLPKELITVESAGAGLVLKGQVSDPEISERAAKVCMSYIRAAGVDAKVLNFLNIRGDQQVQIRVKVAEVSRTYLRQLGLNFMSRPDTYTGGLLSPGTKVDTSLSPDLGTTGTLLQPGGSTLGSGGSAGPMPLLATPFSTDAFGLLFATQAGASFPMSIALNLLQSKGLAKIHSEPTMVAYSGQQGRFLSGGEFPVPIPSGLGQIGIEYKKYGVQLNVAPTVLGNKTIEMKVTVVVSDKDNSGGITIGGVSVPGLTTRLSETTIRLRSGQSFAIAGLLTDKIENVNSKVPLLGDIPVIGMLFRRTEARRKETELVVLATADLVQPLKPGEVPPLPGEDEFSDPDSWSLFLMGWIDAEKKKTKGRSRRTAAGPVGFSN